MEHISKIVPIEGGPQYTIKDAAARQVITKKQDILVSGQNIRTIGGRSLLGSGNIDFSQNNTIETNPQDQTGGIIVSNNDDVKIIEQNPHDPDGGIVIGKGQKFEMDLLMDQTFTKDKGCIIDKFVQWYNNGYKKFIVKIYSIFDFTGKTSIQIQNSIGRITDIRPNRQDSNVLAGNNYKWIMHIYMDNGFDNKPSMYGRVLFPNEINQNAFYQDDFFGQMVMRPTMKSGSRIQIYGQ